MSVTTTRPRLSRQGRRAQIAEAAAGILAERESSEVSFEEIAAAAGVSRSLVYKHFGDRASLLAAAYLHDLERLDRCIDDAIVDCEDDGERLRAVIAAYLAFAEANAASSRLIASLGTLRHPAVQAAIHERIQRIGAHFGGSPEALLIARGVVGLLESATTYWAEYPTASSEDAVDLLFRVLRDGLKGTYGAAELGPPRAAP